MHEVSINQKSLFPKQNVNKINKVISSIDEARLSNLHESIAKYLVTLHVYYRLLYMHMRACVCKLRGTGKTYVNMRAKCKMWLNETHFTIHELELARNNLFFQPFRIAFYCTLINTCPKRCDIKYLYLRAVVFFAQTHMYHYFLFAVNWTILYWLLYK